MKLSLAIAILLFLVGDGSSHMPDIYEFCSHILRERTTNVSKCEMIKCTGTPGKRGPKGERGLPGAQGEIGDGSLLRMEISQLHEKVLLIEMTQKKMMSPSEKIDMCAMGMKSGQIPDSAITTSSNYDSTYAGPKGRLDAIVGAWGAKQDNIDQWIQVDFGETKTISGIVTQGHATSSEWVTTFKVSCSADRQTEKVLESDGEEKVFTANTDNQSKVVNLFPDIMECRYVKIFPQAWNSYISMRLEFLRGDCYTLF